MATSIPLISPEETKKQYLDQYRALRSALAETVRILKAFDVDLPDEGEAQVAGPARPTGSQPYAPAPLPFIKDLVIKSLDHIPKHFAWHDVRDYLVKNFPDRPVADKTLRATLSDMAKGDNPILLVVSVGVAGLPNIYEKNWM